MVNGLDVVLVTGAAGFIGSRLAKTLLEQKAAGRIVGLDNLNDYYSPELKRQHLVDLVTSDRFEFVQGDLRDADFIRQLIEQHQPSAIAHLAAMAAVRYSAKHPLIYGEVNVQGTMNL